MTQFLLYALAFILVLVSVITVHEFGHFAVGKLSGIKVEEFSIGFGPKLYSRTVGETMYAIRAIPAGGFVRMAAFRASIQARREHAVPTRAQPGHNALPDPASLICAMNQHDDRAGRSGRAITFVSGRELYKMQNIMRFTKAKIRRERTHVGRPPAGDPSHRSI